MPRARPALAKRYAEALYELVAPEGQQEEALRALESVRELWRENGELRRALGNPLIPPRVRVQLMQTISATEFPAHVVDLLELILQRHRHFILPALADAFRAVLDEREQRVRVEAIAAVAVPEEFRQRLQRLAKRLAGPRAELVIKQDPSIIGGLILRIGDRVIDASVRGQLERLVQRIKHAPVAPAGGGQ